MALFDSLINDVNNRFNLGDKASLLLTALLTTITDETNGGLRGFLETFRRVGLGSVADSWVAQGANTPLSYQQLADALGMDSLGALASGAGLTSAQSNPAVAYLIPEVINLITPDGVIPENRTLLGTLAPYLGLGTAATASTLGGASGAAVTAVSGEISFLKYLLPLLLAGLLIFVGIQFCGRPNQALVRSGNINANANVKANSNANSNANNSNTSAVVVPANKAVVPRVAIRADGGKYFVTGTVASEAEKTQIFEPLKAQFGEGNVDLSGLKVDAGAKTPSWFAKVLGLFPSFKGWTKGELAFEGENRLGAVGEFPAALSDKIKADFTEFRLPPILYGTGADAQKVATENAGKALETAQTPQEVVDALNLDIINFATGKADIPPANAAILQKAAAVLKNTPAGTNIEIGGHTDNTGDKIKNQKLSEDRANAVKNELVKLGVNAAALTAKGYGDTVQKADNTTENGRFQNRRIEYTLK